MNALLGIGALCIGVISGVLGWLTLGPPVPLELVVNDSVYPLPSASKDQVATQVEAAVQLRTQQLLSQEVAVVANEILLEFSARDWGARIDTSAEVLRALEGLEKAHVTWREDWDTYLYRRLTGATERFVMELSPAVDRGRARAVLTLWSGRIDRAPRDAALKIAEHRVQPSQEGRLLSVDATWVRLDAELKTPGPWVVEASLDPIAPRVTEDDLAPVDVSRVLSSFETSFRGKAGPRATNIRVAGRYLDGTVLLPGEVLSFNDVVGRRIHGRGFVDAPVIVNDEMELDVGGGVCQVATTLHAAAVYGNLEVVRRRSHSRPSGYAPLGLDATVIDGKVDLQLRNPYDEPLLVHVSFPERYKVRVELLGKAPTARVEHAYSVTSREPFSRRVWRRDELLPGNFEKKQKGSPGMDVTSVLSIVHDDGHRERRRYTSKYYPVPEVFWVSEAGDRAALPELPEGATSVVVDGEIVEEPGLEAESRPETDVPSYRDADGSTPRHGYSG